MCHKLKCLYKLVINLEANIDPKNFTKGEWHDQLVYTVFNFHDVYSIPEFKEKINKYAASYKKKEVENEKGIKVLNELPYSNAFLKMYKETTEELWKRISTFNPDCQEWCDSKLTYLNIFCI